MRRERIPGARPGLYVACSLALHAALLALVSLRSCDRDRPSLAGPSEAVDVDLTSALPAPRQTKTPRPGGGVPSARPDAPPHPSHRLAHRPDPSPPPTPPPPPEAAPDEAVPVIAQVDAVAAPSRLDKPSADEVDDASRATGPRGAEPGAHGGPGGRGAGAAGAEVPVVARPFAFGRPSPGPFKGLVCFIPPGVLRIADVPSCAVVAVFYTDTFNIPERHQPEGFPGISDRSTWFMIEYQGAFSVGQDGTYDFRLHSDDGSYLFIDGAMVIENDGKHKPESRSGSIALRVGSHQLRLLYAQTTDRMALQLFVRRRGAGVEQLFAPHI